jgi:competence protein ComEA
MKPLVLKMGLNRIDDKSAGLLLLLLIIIAIFYLKPSLTPARFADVPCPNPVYVQADGDVQHPGVYPFCSPPNLKDLIQKAGGLRFGPPDPVTDRTFSGGTKVILRYNGKRYEVTESGMSPYHKTTLGIPISLNRESEEGLTAIPGIGQSLAKRIVAERARRGGFKELEELRSVPGIGRKLFARIKPSLTL